MVTSARTAPLEATKPARLWMLLSFFAIYVVWGSTYLAIRIAVKTIPPLVTAGIRHTTAGLILLGWAWARGYRPRVEHWKAGLVLGALFFLIGHGTPSLGGAIRSFGPGGPADRVRTVVDSGDRVGAR